ncbi:class I SAM-dependent methyltransferase [Algoriphagus namhaensis]
MSYKIRHYLKQLLNSALEIQALTWFAKPLIEVHAEAYSDYLGKLKEEDERQFFESYSHLLPPCVSWGPFKGLKYPFMQSLHSTLFPKLLGYYECELHDSVEAFLRLQPETILDIGCAEGYYAVGFALSAPDSTVLAFDIQPEAREKTAEMAAANGIEESGKFQIHEEANKQTLLQLDSDKRHFIFSDCEGFEDLLFDAEVIEHLKRSLFIIECHDFIHAGISERLQERFELTHEVQQIASVDDHFRYQLINHEELKKIPLEDQIRLLAEKRPAQMNWLVCKPLKS